MPILHSALQMVHCKPHTLQYTVHSVHWTVVYTFLSVRYCHQLILEKIPSSSLLTLHCTAPHYTTLHSNTFYYATLHYYTLHYTALHYTTLHYTALHCTKLHSSAQHCTTLHRTTLQHAALFIALHCTPILPLYQWPEAV